MVLINIMIILLAGSVLLVFIIYYRPKKIVNLRFYFRLFKNDHFGIMKPPLVISDLFSIINENIHNLIKSRYT